MPAASATTTSVPLSQWLAQRAPYPLFMAASLLAAAWALSAGAAPGLVVAGVSLVGAAITAGLERILPFERSWNRGHGDWGADLLHALVSNLAFIQVLRATVLAGLVTLGVAASAGLGFALWPHALPLAAQVALGLVLGELSFYGFHRWMHQGDRAWSFHVVHHSATRLYWLNGLRTHPINTFGSFLSFQAPLVLLGAAPSVMALVAVFHAAHGLMQHANLDVKLGWLNWIVSGPELHRWHHSPVVAEANHNYGNNLAVWDVLFGTRYLPADRTPPHEVGISGMPLFPRAWWPQILVPLRWRAVQAEAAGEPAPEANDGELAAPAR